MKEITMPKLSDTMVEGTVVAWRKAPGERVERGDVIAEVETDKATMELEAFSSGTLLEIRIPAGAAVPVGTVIGLIGESSEKAVIPTEPPAKATDTAAVAAPPAQPVASVRTPSPSTDASLAAPVVRRRALELGIELSKVTGSGSGGRILLEDLEPTATVGREVRENPPARATTADAPQADSRSEGEPLSKMRQAIALTVKESWRSIPQFSVTVEVRMGAAEQFRQEQGAKGETVSLTALLARCVAMALPSFPLLNASLREENVILHQEINIGIVVRRDDGLLVPVLRDCSGLTLAETAMRTSRLISRARQGQLSQSELTGGTFAISNLGMYQVRSFVALILPPMAGVLAVGALRDGLVARDGRPVVEKLMSLTLSADHRLVDGVYAAEFLQKIRLLLESPESLDR